MTCIIIDSKERAKSVITGAMRLQFLEEMDSLGTRFKEAERFRLDAKLQPAAMTRRAGIDVVYALPEVLADPPPLFLCSDKFLERPRQRADASLNVFRNELREEVEQAIGVSEPIGICPVGAINLLLHLCAMKLTERKSVNRENVTLVLPQPTAKGFERPRLAQLARGEIAQTQADSIRTVGTNSLLYKESILFERREGFRPIFTTMNICAVSEMEVIFKSHPVSRCYQFPRGEIWDFG
jgi:hypothetical protein